MPKPLKPKKVKTLSEQYGVPVTLPGTDTPMPVPEVYDAMLTRLTMGQRDDFVRMLARWMQVAPGVDADPDSTAALRLLARKFPDRFMQGMTMVARLAGMTTERVEVTGSITIAALVKELPELSDAELYRRAREMWGPAEPAALPPAPPNGQK